MTEERNQLTGIEQCDCGTMPHAPTCALILTPGALARADVLRRAIVDRALRGDVGLFVPPLCEVTEPPARGADTSHAPPPCTCGASIAWTGETNAHGADCPANPDAHDPSPGSAYLDAAPPEVHGSSSRNASPPPAIAPDAVCGDNDGESDAPPPPPPWRVISPGLSERVAKPYYAVHPQLSFVHIVRPDAPRGLSESRCGIVFDSAWTYESRDPNELLRANRDRPWVPFAGKVVCEFCEEQREGVERVALRWIWHRSTRPDALRAANAPAPPAREAERAHWYQKGHADALASRQQTGDAQIDRRLREAYDKGRDEAAADCLRMAAAAAIAVTARASIDDAGPDSAARARLEIRRNLTQLGALHRSEAGDLEMLVELYGQVRAALLEYFKGEDAAAEHAREAARARSVAAAVLSVHAKRVRDGVTDPTAPALFAASVLEFLHTLEPAGGQGGAS